MLSFLLVAILAYLACRSVTGDTGAPYRAPLIDIGGPDKNKDVYIVLFKDDYTLEDHWDTISTDYSFEPDFNNWEYFSAYTARLNATALDYVRRDPSVECVETDRRLHLHHSSLQDASDRTTDSDIQDSTPAVEDDFELDVDDNQDCEEPKGIPWFIWRQISPPTPWNLAVISARGKDEHVAKKKEKKKKLEGEYTVGSWDYMSEPGKGVDVYIVDTGINIDHKWFGGRASNFLGKSSSAISPYTHPPAPYTDTKNHGTGVAGIIGADHVGIARAANLINVKVAVSAKKKDLYSKIVVSKLGNALHDILVSHLFSCTHFAADDQRFRGSIINFSSGFTERVHGVSYGSMRRMFWRPQWYGIVVIATAGNEGQSATAISTLPCMVTGVICVGAINKEYNITWFSNWMSRGLGSERWNKFYFAPGEMINTTSSAGGTSTEMVNGTSYACPHVTGVAAMIMGYLGLARGDDHIKIPVPMSDDVSAIDPRDEFNQYLISNALKGVVGFGDRTFPKGDELNPQDNLLVNTGIHNSAKQPGAPFRGPPGKLVPTERTLVRQECRDKDYWKGI